MREILKSRWFHLLVDDDARIVRRVRTAERFETVAEIDGAYAALCAAFDGLDRPRFAQLADAREAPARNDPQFEAVVTRYHPRLYAGFRAAAALVRTAAGRLQMRRMFDTSGVDVRVFSDEAEAIAYLTSTR